MYNVFMELKVKQTLKEKWGVEYGTIFAPSESDKRYLLSEANGKEIVCKRVNEIQMVSVNGKQEKVEVQKWRNDKELLDYFLNSDIKVICYPYIPMEKMVYWYGYMDIQGNFNVAKDIWLDRSCDYERYKLKNCFRTEEFAREHAKEIVENIRLDFIDDYNSNYLFKKEDGIRA